jgi:hypothetical protein
VDWFLFCKWERRHKARFIRWRGKTVV